MGRRHRPVRSLIRDRVVVSHTAFDRVAFSRVCSKYGLEPGEVTWLDSASVVRRAWPQFARSGYGLSSVAEHFGIDYRAHEATEDARCAGEILLRAVGETGLTIEKWLTRVQQPIDPWGESP
jgi:DNA polymerase-3 subunit epsilon